MRICMDPRFVRRHQTSKTPGSEYLRTLHLDLDCRDIGATDSDIHHK